MLVIEDFGYKVIIGHGVLGKLVDALNPGASSVCIVADERVYSIHGQKLISCLPETMRVEKITFPPGEAGKTRQTKEFIEDTMLGAGLDRDTNVLSFGGGVTSDLAGFVAGTYMRGIQWTSVPTSLLAAVDASLGGKTGVDTKYGKNLVGMIHQPRAVLIDVDLLSTLPAGEVENGLAEMVKHAVLADRSYLSSLVRAGPMFTSDPVHSVDLIAESVKIKAIFAAHDIHDHGTRRILNFGHTIGHALELATGYGISHGRAVSIGMCAELWAAVISGLFESADLEYVCQALLNLGLPVSLPKGVSPEEILQAMTMDKKRANGRIFISLPRGMGKPYANMERPVVVVQEDTVLSALEKVAK